MIRLCSLLLALCAACPVAALDVTLPGSAQQSEGQSLGLDSYALPTGVFAGGTVPSRIFEGFVERQAWRIEGAGVTPLQILQPLRADLSAAGYETIFECADTVCGGFDFRFGTDVMDPPAMLVDLDAYHFLSALKGETDAPSGAVSFLVSQSNNAVYLQIIRVSVERDAAIRVGKGAAVSSSTDPALPALPVEGSKQLSVSGHVILDDLVFATGSAELGSGPFGSLQQVADYLRANPTHRIALVGHTDAVGGLDGNIALSRRRATSVMTRLIEAFGVPQAQLTSDGVGGSAAALCGAAAHKGPALSAQAEAKPSLP